MENLFAWFRKERAVLDNVLESHYQLSTPRKDGSEIVWPIAG